MSFYEGDIIQVARVTVQCLLELRSIEYDVISSSDLIDSIHAGYALYAYTTKHWTATESPPGIIADQERAHNELHQLSRNLDAAEPWQLVFYNAIKAITNIANEEKAGEYLEELEQYYQEVLRADPSIRKVAAD